MESRTTLSPKQRGYQPWRLVRSHHLRLGLGTFRDLEPSAAAFLPSSLLWLSFRTEIHYKGLKLFLSSLPLAIIIVDSCTLLIYTATSCFFIDLFSFWLSCWMKECLIMFSFHFASRSQIYFKLSSSNFRNLAISLRCSFAFLLSLVTLISFLSVFSFHDLYLSNSNWFFLLFLKVLIKSCLSS